MHAFISRTIIIVIPLSMLQSCAVIVIVVVIGIVIVIVIVIVIIYSFIKIYCQNHTYLPGTVRTAEESCNTTYSRIFSKNKLNQYMTSPLKLLAI